MMNNIYILCGGFFFTLSLISAENNQIVPRNNVIVERARAQEHPIQPPDAFDIIDSALGKIASTVCTVNSLASGLSSLEAYKCYSLGPLNETKRILTWVDVTRRTLNIGYIAEFAGEAIGGLVSSLACASVNRSDSVALPLIATATNVASCFARHALLDSENNYIVGYDFIDQYLNYGHLALATFNVGYFGFLTGYRILEYARKNKIFKEDGTLNI